MPATFTRRRIPARITDEPDEARVEPCEGERHEKREEEEEERLVAAVVDVSLVAGDGAEEVHFAKTRLSSLRPTSKTVGQV